MLYVIEEGPVSCYETTERTEGFGECAHDQVHPVSNPEMISRSPPAVAEDSESMSVIHHYGSIVPVCKVQDYRQRGDVSAH